MNRSYSFTGQLSSQTLSDRLVADLGKLNSGRTHGLSCLSTDHIRALRQNHPGRMAEQNRQCPRLFALAKPNDDFHFPSLKNRRKHSLTEMTQRSKPSCDCLPMLWPVPA